MAKRARALAIGAVATAAVAVAWGVAPGVAETGLQPLGETSGSGPSLIEQSLAAARRGAEWLEAAHHRRPLLTIGLAGAAVLPLLALAGLALYRRGGAAACSDAELATAGDGEVVGGSYDGAGTAFLALADGARISMPEGRDLIQIGRESDNDVCLRDETVHRYHAVIERMAGQGFAITYIGGVDGNGLEVNGAALTRAPLADGDTIKLGRTEIVFQTAA